MDEKLRTQLVPVLDNWMKESTCFRDAYLNNPQALSLAKKLSHTRMLDKFIDLIRKTFTLIFELLEEEGLLQEKPYLQINSNNGSDTGIAVFHKGHLVFSRFVDLKSLNPADKEEFTKTASSWRSDVQNGIQNGHYSPFENEEEDDPWWRHR